MLKLDMRASIVEFVSSLSAEIAMPTRFDGSPPKALWKSIVKLTCSFAFPVPALCKITLLPSSLK